MRSPVTPRSLRRAGLSLVATAVVTAGMAVTAPAPSAHAENPGPAHRAAVWIEDQLTDGLLYNAQYDIDDYGLTIEAAYALDAIGQTDSIGAITARLRNNVDAYVAPSDGEQYAGSTGKLLAYVTELTTADPTDFGGTDLVARMEALTVDGGTTAGRIGDVSQWGDYANTFGQAYAVAGLTAAGSPEAAAARGFLLQQQCADGFFRLSFAAPDAANQSCDDADPAESAPPVDTSALVTILLWELGQTDQVLGDALADAVAWIQTRQADDGSFDGGTATEGANANSTGLAAWALHLAGADQAAADGAAWVRARQLHEPARSACPSPVTGHAGAIAYDDAVLSEARTSGLPVEAIGQWRFSTVQAAPGLLAVPDDAEPAARTVALCAPTGHLRAGSKATVVVTGIPHGETATITGGKTPVEITGTGGPATAQVTLRAGTANRTLTVDTGDQQPTVSVSVLGAKKLKVATKAKVRKRGKQKVRIRGLVARESVKVTYRGKVVARGKANANGVFRARFAVGKKKGRYAVKATGAFNNRKGSVRFKVV